MKKGYENEIRNNIDNGQLKHDKCLDHCLLHAFGECNDEHNLRCVNCLKFHNFFKKLIRLLPENELENIKIYRQKLYYYLAHQTRKVYLNAQFSSNLLELDKNGAIIIVDYKMRILPKTARETKTEFFGKRGWTLHSILMYTKFENQEDYNITAYDHWSDDTKQDAWFTASSLSAVFETMLEKPKWITIISDNGPHYHNSEMMVILSHWKDWYDIIIRKWIFLEAGEAKTTIDSHHAQVNLL
jgi:hypothetical protein